MNRISLSAACKFLPLVLVFFLTIAAQAQEISKEPAAIQAGQAVFNANCKTCHAVNKKVVGPALKGVTDRAPSIQWIKDFVHNSAKVIASGDEYAKKVYEENNKTQMTAFTGLKDDEIMNVLAYIVSEGSKADAAPVPGPGGATVAKNEGGEGVPSSYLNIILVGMLIILVLLMIILAFMVSSMKRFLENKELSEEDREVVFSPINFSTVVRSSGFIFLVTFIVAALGFKAVINGLYYRYSARLCSQAANCILSQDPRWSIWRSTVSIATWE
ncbi:MAG: cytochrome c [Chryseolinea sp.]